MKLTCECKVLPQYLVPCLPRSAHGHYHLPIKIVEHPKTQLYLILSLHLTKQSDCCSSSRTSFSCLCEQCVHVHERKQLDPGPRVTGDGDT